MTIIFSLLFNSINSLQVTELTIKTIKMLHVRILECKVLTIWYISELDLNKILFSF